MTHTRAEHVPMLVKVDGSLGSTKWMILPALQYGGTDLEAEYMETNMWVPDVGTISNITIYVDWTGEFVVGGYTGKEINPWYIRVIDMASNGVAVASYNSKFGNGNDIATPMTLGTATKFYDLINTHAS